jgi:cytochrome P450
MSSEDPVHYSESLGYWILTRYRDVEAAVRDERLSSDRTALFINKLGSLDVKEIQNFLDLTSNMMIDKDPPEHSRLRVNALLCHPDQLQKLKKNPTLINSAVEEILRFDTSVPFLTRIAKQDLTIGGKDITAGSVIALGLGPANHDPEKFEEPEVFDITRTPNEHLGFSSGIHFCLGAVLAPMDLTICLTTLLRRLPNLSGAPDKHAIPTHTSLVFKGFDSLPVKFDDRLK